MGCLGENNTVGKKAGREGLHPPSPRPLINNKHKENLTLASLRKNKSSLLPSINTERFKKSFMNRLYFKYRFGI